MKYFLLSILLLPSILSADTQTTGNQKFLLPSTGVVDASRNWGDKYNENWRIADSSMTNLQSAVNAVQTDTTTIFNALKSTSVQLSNYLTANATNTNLLSSSSVWTASQRITSSMTVEGSTIGLREYDLVFATAPTAGQHLIASRVNGRNVLISGGDIPSGGGGTVENSTRAVTITVGGEIVYSSATPPFFPGAWWSTTASSCTITKVQAVVQNPSLASAVFPFYAVQQSSWQWSQYGVLAVTTSTQRSIVKNEAILVTSSNSFIVGVASAPVSNPASNLGLWFQYWCNP